MGAVDYGTQTILFRYKEEADSDKLNKAYNSILGPGVYSGLQVNKVANNKISISPGSFVISDGTYTIRVSTSVITTQDILCSSTNCFVVARWSYAYSQINYVSFLCTDTPQDYDLILGKIEYTGPVLSSINYSYRTYGNQHRTKILIDSITNQLYLNPGTNFWFVDSDGFSIEYISILEKTTIGSALSGANNYYILFDGTTYSTSTTATGLAYSSAYNGWYDSSGNRVLGHINFDGTTTITVLNSYEGVSYNVTVPVKATGAELDTGADDAKFATAKALADSGYATESYADGKIAKTTDVTAINDTGIADGEIAVFNKTNKDIRTSDKTIVTTLGADDTTVPTSKAVKDVTDGKMANPMTTQYDIIIGGASGTPARLEKGSDGTFLGVSGGTVSYLTPTVGGIEADTPFYLDL